MADMVIALKKTGVAIVLSEQNLPFAELVSDRAYVIEKGEMRFSGTMQELSANEQLRRAYLEV
jgi:branched-chain amino acid transport system ATP-binding protein